MADLELWTYAADPRQVAHVHDYVGASARPAWEGLVYWATDLASTTEPDGGDPPATRRAIAALRADPARIEALWACWLALPKPRPTELSWGRVRDALRELLRAWGLRPEDKT